MRLMPLGRRTRRGIALWLLIGLVSACGGSDQTTEAASATAPTSTSPTNDSTAVEQTTAGADPTITPATAAATTSTRVPSQTAPLETTAPPTTGATLTSTVTTSATSPTALPTTTDSPLAAPAGSDGFSFVVSPITAALAKRMTPTSWREGCPVALADLRYLSIAYRDFSDVVQVGELVVHADVVSDTKTAFEQLFVKGVHIRRMKLVDDYGGDDFASIENDNTSAFNCRPVTGGSGWSEHAYGRALDINPLENPYVLSGRTSHAGSVTYLDRDNARQGMANDGGPLVAAFEAVGWGWGGRWDNPVDYQHFSKTGR